MDVRQPKYGVSTCATLVLLDEWRTLDGGGTWMSASAAFT